MKATADIFNHEVHEGHEVRKRWFFEKNPMIYFVPVVYFVVGATHPMIVRRHGEAYRMTLEREAEKLGVREHVVFRDQFVTIDELCSYLQASDIFVSPYLNEAQVTSGALSYAMGAGAAVVSTPFVEMTSLSAIGMLVPVAASVVRR